LYLRLNGYLTTSFIVHAPGWGDNFAQIDALAVRHAGHAEPEREIPSDERLDPSTTQTDVLICEVKSLNEPLQFASKLRDEEHVLRAVLRWVGVLDDAALYEAVPMVLPLLRIGCPAADARRGASPRPAVRIRPLFLQPERDRARPNQPWVICGDELLDYVARCLSNLAVRPASSVRYDFTAWGPWLEPIVSYFKDLRDHEHPSMTALYAYTGVARASRSNS